MAAILANADSTRAYRRREIPVHPHEAWSAQQELCCSHFGGGLFAMIDPFYMIMHMHLPGAGYLVWDGSAKIKFIAPAGPRFMRI